MRLNVWDVLLMCGCSSLMLLVSGVWCVCLCGVRRFVSCRVMSRRVASRCIVVGVRWSRCGVVWCGEVRVSVVVWCVALCCVM